MAEWSNEKILSFINEIRIRPELWDVDSNAYKNRKLKQASWLAIAAMFDVTNIAAYKKFRNLRTYAQTELKRKNSGNDGKKTWFAYDAISFILGDDSQADVARTDSETNTMENVTITEETDKSDNYDSEETSDPLTAPPPRKIFRKNPYSTRIQKIDTSYEKAAHIINGIGNDRNLYSAFGEHVANKLSTYDNYTRAQAEFKISEVLFNADMGMYRNDAFNITVVTDEAGSSNDSRNTCKREQ